MRATMMQVPLSLNHLLERAGRYFAGNEIVSRLPDKSLRRHRYGEFHRRTRQLAAALQAAGLQKGDRVATLCWNHHAHLEAYFGIPAAGGVMHTLKTCGSRHRRFGWIAAMLRPASDRRRRAAAAVPPVRRHASLREGDRVPRSPVRRCRPIHRLRKADRRRRPRRIRLRAARRERCRRDVLHVGHHGRSKGVVYSHRSTVLHTLVGCLGRPLGPEEHRRRAAR
jgi:fatty-acyl-CoA synthase